MKFGLDTSLNMRYYNGREERTTECSTDCECIRYIHSVSLADDPLSLERGADLLNLMTPLQQAEHVYWQMVCEDRWLVCQPEGSGHLLVTDGEGKTFLDQLARSTTLKALLSSGAQVSPERVMKILHLFLSVGVMYLRDRSAVSGSLPQDEELSVWLHVTNSCNLGCDYCYLAKTGENMSEETALRAVDAVFRSARRQHFLRFVL